MSELNEVNNESLDADSDETVRIVYNMRIISDVYPSFCDFCNFSTHGNMRISIFHYVCCDSDEITSVPKRLSAKTSERKPLSVKTCQLHNVGAKYRRRNVMAPRRQRPNVVDN